jgi:hypothetical protein
MSYVIPGLGQWHLSPVKEVRSWAMGRSFSTLGVIRRRCRFKYCRRGELEIVTDLMKFSIFMAGEKNSLNERDADTRCLQVVEI